MVVLRKLALYSLYWIIRFVVSLRYRIDIVGFDEIARTKNEGILFLPNHPAEIDPVIISLILWPRFKTRPLVTEEFFFQGGIRFMIDLIHGLQIPQMTSANKWKERQIEKTKVAIDQQLNKGENFLIYPSGRLMRTGVEQIGGASFISDLMKMNPDRHVVLIRSTGLWGSSFSREPTKTSPDFGKALKKGFLAVLKNGIFFTPRRSIKVELEWAPNDFPRKAEKLEFNRWLENWYNKRGPEPVNRVSYLFWKKEFPEEQAAQEERQEDVKLDLSGEKRKKVLAYLSELSSHPEADLKPNLHLLNDLGLDSIDIGQLIVFLEDQFDIGRLALGQLQTINDVFQAAAGGKEQAEDEQSSSKPKWPKEAPRPVIEIPPGQTIPEVFLNSCERMKHAIACADAVSGVLSYKRLKQGALVLSLKIQEMPGDYIGILLPSSVGAYLAVLATLLAGKIPVMLNWTAGFRNLEHAAEVCGLKTILSSYRFLSKAGNVDLGKTDDLLILLEELRHRISLKTKLQGLFLSFFSTAKILKKLPRQIKEEDTAVVLFTSGTETLPKGVPLTHRNLLSNQINTLSIIPIFPTDIFYAVLPPFHSFGFTVTGLIPLLSGIKVCYAPDPTNSRSLARDIEHWKCTIFCCAPGFIKGVLNVAKEGQLNSLRLIVSGAEKAPQELLDTIQAMGKTPLEGYGISECSPVVCGNRIGKPLKGVGQPIPEVELCIINPDDGTVLPQGQDGEVCITGPSVFNGYLGIKKDPFITLNGKRWYRSGDRGHLEPDGALVLSGRLTRFIKIGGEMVSLGAVEEDLLKICKDKGWIAPNADLPQLAVGVKDKEGEKSQIILYVIGDVNREEANIALRELGHGSIVKISEVKQVSEIPLTGTGKVQYRVLDELL